MSKGLVDNLGRSLRNDILKWQLALHRSLFHLRYDQPLFLEDDRWFQSLTAKERIILNARVGSGRLTTPNYPLQIYHK
ncbi:hypothetical protein RN22_12170 [Grimontia sp. AD028]|nr:hypothetical protein RN22_12170 [Grimontia sp. AD028]